MEYICLLRGINVGGKNKVVMSELKASLSETFSAVQTYLNSGNVILQSEKTKEAVQSSVEDTLEKMTGHQIKVLVFIPEAMEAIVKAYPFEAVSKHCYFTLFSDGIVLNRDAIVAKKKPEDCYEINHDVIYLNVPGGYGKTKLTNGFFEKLAGQAGTTRNMNTLRKLIEMTKKA